MRKTKKKTKKKEKEKSIFSIYDPLGVTLLARLRLQFSHLAEHKFRHGFRDTINARCACRREVETTEHFLLRCQLYSAQRLKLFENREKIDSSFFNLNVKDKVNFGMVEKWEPGPPGPLGPLRPPETQGPPVPLGSLGPLGSPGHLGPPGDLGPQNSLKHLRPLGLPEPPGLQDPQYVRILWISRTSGPSDLLGPQDPWEITSTV